MNAETSLVQGISGALLVGLAGFLYLHTSYFQRFSHAAASQRTQTSLAFAFGIGFLFLAGIIRWWCESRWPEVSSFLHDAWASISPVPRLDTVFALAPVLGLLVGVLSNVRRLVHCSDEKYLADEKHPLHTTDLRARMRLAALDHVSRATDDRMLSTLWRAITLGKLVQVSLKNRKVYVGSPLSSSDPSVESRWLKIVPMASGYRDTDTLTYIATTDYRSLFEELASGASKETKLPPNVDASDLGILICWSEIVSLTIYAPELEKYFGIEMESELDDASEAV